MNGSPFGLTLALVMALAGTAACSEPSPAAKGAESPAASAQAEADGAEAFVRSLYSTENGGTGDGAEAPIWSARTAALIAEMEAASVVVEASYWEVDPICACQDNGGMMLRSVAVTPTGPDRADATVAMEWTMAQPVDTIRQTFNLVREGGAWKIDDIQRDQTEAFPQPPLVQDMTRWIAEAKATSPGAGA